MAQTNTAEVTVASMYAVLNRLDDASIENIAKWVSSWNLRNEKL